MGLDMEGPKYLHLSNVELFEFLHRHEVHCGVLDLADRVHSISSSHAITWHNLVHLALIKGNPTIDITPTLSLSSWQITS